MRNNELYHFGILGMKWGVRRFQNEDGTLTPEGRERYLGSDYDRSIGAITKANYDIYAESVDRANRDIPKINDKYKGVDLNDDRNNLQYTKEIRDMWQKHYRDVLAKDLGTDSSKLVGQKWLEEMYGYMSNLDIEVADLERKVKEQEEKKQSAASGKNGQIGVKISKTPKEPKTVKMTQEQAIKKVYSDLEKKYPNFNDLPLDQQDTLFFNYANTSGLYKYI